MADFPEFHFDFEAIKGKSYEDGFKALFGQLETHYNTYINKKPSFVFGVDPATPGADRIVTMPVTTDDGTPVVEAGNTEREGNRKEAPRADHETITPKTIPLAKFQLDPGDNDTVLLTGTADDGTEIHDILLAGYETLPIGPVVSGRRGRYNLKQKVEG
jgi:hypothetical protein